VKRPLPSKVDRLPTKVAHRWALSKNGYFTATVNLLTMNDNGLKEMGVKKPRLHAECGAWGRSDLKRGVF
jgi:hypothetical protein